MIVDGFPMTIDITNIFLLIQLINPWSKLFKNIVLLHGDGMLITTWVNYNTYVINNTYLLNIYTGTYTLINSIRLI